MNITLWLKMSTNANETRNYFVQGGGQTNLQLQVPLFLSQYSIENRQSMERLEQQFQLIIDEQIE